MRAGFTLMHRWGGLFIALFLLISGLTGAIISWDHELDEWLNPHLFEDKATGPTLAPLELVRRVETADPRVQVTYVPLSFETGHNAALFVEPRIDAATGALHALAFNQVFISPVSGEIAGRRYWGAVSLDRENLLPFLYKLHYSMHIPTVWGLDRLGVWFMGIVAIVWMFDCFVGFALTLPRGKGQATPALTDDTAHDAGERRTWWQRWKPAWRIKRGASTYRLNLDLHRAFGLWLWLMLFILAFTSISMNLGYEVVRPILSRISTLTPDPFSTRASASQPIAANLSFAQAIEAAGIEARRRGWSEPSGSAFYGRLFGLYAIGFFQPGDDHGSAGMGVKTIVIDAASGAITGSRVPWQGTAGDLFLQLQFPIHSGRIAGIPGRVFISFVGLVVAMLSATGIYIWFKKRAARIGRTRAPAPRARRQGIAMPRPDRLQRTPDGPRREAS